MHMNRTFKQRMKQFPILIYWMRINFGKSRTSERDLTFPTYVCVLNIKSIVKSNQERSSQDYASNLSKQQGELCN